MLKIDTETMTISMTKGDAEYIVFSAEDDEGQEYVPVTGDILKFGVAKKVDTDPIFQIENTMDDDAEEFWTIEIKPEHTRDMKIIEDGYAFDVELMTSTGPDTIIGETDTVHPTFILWGDVAK